MKKSELQLNPHKTRHWFVTTRLREIYNSSKTEAERVGVIHLSVPKSEWYSKLRGQVDDRILWLQDGRGGFLLDKVDERSVKYFYNNCVNKPWRNHILLAMLIHTDRNLDPLTVFRVSSNIHSRMKDLFRAFSLDNVNEFDVDVHMYKYLKEEVYPEHSASQRSRFLNCYKTTTYYTSKWLSQRLSQEEQVEFSLFKLPEFSFDQRDFTFSRLAKEQAKENRKDETDAILPYLPAIRESARFRYNQIKRLRESFQKAVNDAQKRSASLPTFHYDEPKRIGERFYFRLWDKPSFVLRHKSQFAPNVVRMAEKRKGTYTDDNNHFFVEFIKAERLIDEEEPEGLLFLELIEHGVLSQWSQNASDEEIERKRKYLYSWGYGEEDSATDPKPFFSGHKGIVGQSMYVSIHKDKAEGLLFE